MCFCFSASLLVLCVCAEVCYHCGEGEGEERRGRRVGVERDSSNSDCVRGEL